MRTTTRSYFELQSFASFEERFEYLSLQGHVGDSTFGHNRYMNQAFYTSSEWRRTRYDVIARDLGCDLGIPGFEIHSRIAVHHINPITPEDIENGSYNLFDLNNLICASHDTHNAIHYGSSKVKTVAFVERRPGDTQLWKRRGE